MKIIEGFKVIHSYNTILFDVMYATRISTTKLPANPEC